MIASLTNHFKSGRENHGAAKVVITLRVMTASDASSVTIPSEAIDPRRAST